MKPDEFKEIVRNVMFERGLTQGELAAMIGCTRISLNRFLNDKQDLSATLILRLCEVLGAEIRFKMVLAHGVRA